MSDALLAYMVRNEYEASACVVFAGDPDSASLLAAGELDCCVDDLSEPELTPRFDCHAPGPVPFEALLVDWRFECGACGVIFDKHGRCGICETAEEEESFAPFSCQDGIFCSPACHVADWVKQCDRHARRDAVIEAALLHWPMATGVNAERCYLTVATSRMPKEKWRASFRLPALSGDVHWYPHSGRVLCDSADQMNFHRLYRSILDTL